MKYSDGHKIKVGDKVKLWEGCFGEVVASIDEGDYSTGYPKFDWDYLKKGVLINSDEAGLIHYLEPEKTLILLKRAENEDVQMFESD